MDPWYDYLALPIGPAVLLVQGVALSFPRPVRLVANAAGTVALAVMCLLVWVLPEDGGANIGGALLAIMVAVSLALTVRAFGRSDT